MFRVAQEIISEDGLDGLADLSMSVQNPESGEYDDYESDEIMLTLQALRVQEWVGSHHRAKVARPDRQRWLLRAIGWGHGRYPWTQIPFTKAAFLLQRSEKPFSGLDYEFSAYSYGPWDPQVTDDLDSLVVQGCLTMHPIPGSKGIEYRLTDWGRKRVEGRAFEVDDDLREEVVKVATRVTAKHWTIMLRELYEEFPDIAENTILK